MSEERTEEPAASGVVEEPPAAPEAPTASAATATAPPPSPITPGAAAPGGASNGDGRAESADGERDVSFDEFAASMAQGGSFRALKEGDVVRGVVVHIDREGVLV